MDQGKNLPSVLTLSWKHDILSEIKTFCLGRTLQILLGQLALKENKRLVADLANVPWSFFCPPLLSWTKHLISTQKLIFSLQSLLLGLALTCLAFLFDGRHQVLEWLKGAAARLASFCVRTSVRRGSHKHSVGKIAHFSKYTNIHRRKVQVNYLIMPWNGTFQWKTWLETLNVPIEAVFWCHELHRHTNASNVHISCVSTCVQDEQHRRVSTLKIHVRLWDAEGLGDGPLLPLRYQGNLKWGKCIICNPWISLATN